MSDVPSQTIPAARQRFFGTRDWLAFGITTGVALVVYLFTLAPSVTLEDSGEFITAAHCLGVPHPPGYPVWTILAWLWQRVIPFGNVAWRINAMSAVFSAIAAGLATMLVFKSGRTMAARIGFLNQLQSVRLVRLIIMAAAVTAGLILAFCPVMWSQAVIAEVYGLNACVLLLTLVTLYRWSFEPGRMWRLYLAALLWGIGLTVHQTLVLLTVAFPAYIWFVDRKLGRDVLVPILVVIMGGVIKMMFTPGSMFRQGAFPAVVLLVLATGAGAWLYFLWKQGPGLLRQWPRVLAIYGAVALGMACYVYEPVASATNPPMNWGYTRTWDGFVHHFTRGQYDKVFTDRSLVVGERSVWTQFNGLIQDVLEQFNVVFALLALGGLFFYRDIDLRDRRWLRFLFIGFLWLSLGFLFLSNPTFEKQKQFTDRVFFLPSHCIYALWIGYGLIFGLGFLFSEKPKLREHALPIIGVVFLLPVVSIIRNWSDNEQRGHYFGYEFGYRMFQPGGGYPDMDRGAVLYGGTDPGRFVPTHMIFVESQERLRGKTQMEKFIGSETFDRRDVSIITQNALADGTYMNYIRDHYGFWRPDPGNPNSLTNRPAWQNSVFRWSWTALGRNQDYPPEPMWMPSETDVNQAFQRYVEELRSRAPLPGEEVRVENGRVQVQGTVGVMAINGYLTKQIFDRNKDKHTFYVEESYPISWMYPYLEPYGIIMKLNPEPLAQLAPEAVTRDRAYWAELAKNLLADPRYRRDDNAQKAFSKLRAAIGGLYVHRRMYAEAVAVYRQAIELCRESPEANYRLAQLYMERERFAEALKVLADFQQLDRFNMKVAEAVKTVHDFQRLTDEGHELEQFFRVEPNNIPLAIKLVVSLGRRQKLEAMDQLVGQLLTRDDFSSANLLEVANVYAQMNRVDRVIQLLMLFVQRHPQDPTGWYNLAMAHAVRGNCSDALFTLERALAVDTPQQQYRAAAMQDPRLASCRKDPYYQRIMSRTPPENTPGLPFTITR